MKSVNISELKAKLSHYVRQVQKGRVFTVLDRKLPVAKLVPFTDSSSLPIQPATQSVSKLIEVLRNPQVLPRSKQSSTEVLLADRRKR